MKVQKLPREQKERMIEEVQHFFETERGEAIGSIAAEAFLDYMMKVIGPYTYNQGLADARRAAAERFAALEDDLYTMEQPLQRSVR